MTTRRKLFVQAASLGAVITAANMGALGAAKKDANRVSKSRNFVLVHGAFHGGWCYGRVADILRAEGHRVQAPTLTGLGERSHLIGFAINRSTHIQDVVNVIKWESLNDVILCGHSYGGFVVGGVADRIPEQIASIVYLDAGVPEERKIGARHAELASAVRSIERRSNQWRRDVARCRGRRAWRQTWRWTFSIDKK